MKQTETILCSYKMTHDTMMAPNPLFGILTLATCKPAVRRSPNIKPGMWIAGWTACTIHNSPIAATKVDRCKMGEEKLVYLAKISEIIPLEEYWKKYPKKRPVKGSSEHDACFYGDNYYYKENGEKKEAPNNHHQGTCFEIDWKGKNAIICEEFYYFSPENRLHPFTGFEHLVHKGRGHSFKKERVAEFIEKVKVQANRNGVQNGIVGDINLNYNAPE